MTVKHTFPTVFGRDIFRHKYAQGPNDTWPVLAQRVVEDVCGDQWGKQAFPLLRSDQRKQLVELITNLEFIPAGRYLYYAGRPLKFFNNCYCLKAEEDSRQEWGRLGHAAFDALMSGGGIGCDYSVLRASGAPLSRTGGIASGPIPLMKSLNEIGRNVMQGGSRRSALYASLNWKHSDIHDFIHSKTWSPEVKRLKEEDFNFPAPLDMTNISVNWDTEFIDGVWKNGVVPDEWLESVELMCQTGEPGHSYNFWHNERETLRNACTEFTSEDDSDVCNLGSINMARFNSIEAFASACALAAQFLVCGTLRADVPYAKVAETRNRNRKIGLGLMGVHEWLLRRGYSYEPNEELGSWLKVYAEYSETGANEICDRLYLNRPKKYRAIAPTGTIGILAGTTTGIEPLYAVAYKRRYLDSGSDWRYQYVVDGTAQKLIAEGIDPDKIETAFSLASDVKRRVELQKFVQQFVDMGVSSTINLPAWGSPLNNPDTVKDIAAILIDAAPHLRGITVYPDGARGGQPLTVVSYSDAIRHEGVVFEENEERCSGGICGI